MRIQAGRQQQVERRRLECSDRDPREAALGQCPCKIEWDVDRRRLCTPRHQHPDSFLLEAASDEREHALGGGIEPLDIVDADEQRPFAGQHREHAEGGEGNGALQGLLRPRAPSAAAPPREHGAAAREARQSPSPRSRPSRSPSADIRQLDLRLDRPAGQHPVRAICGRGKARLPQRRLPNPGFTLEKQRDRATLDRAQEPVQAP